MTPAVTATVRAYLPPARKGRGSNQNKRKTHCKHGHKLQGKNIYWYTRDGRPQRHCRACLRVYWAAHHLRKREQAASIAARAK